MPKAVHLLVNQMLPERLRSNDREYNKKEVNELVREVSVEDPDRYASFVNSLKDLGRKSVYLQGATLRLDDFEAGFDKQAVLDKMDAELAGLDLIKDDKRRQAKRMEIYTRYTDKFTDLALKHGKQKGSALAGIIASGARGNPSQYRSMIATPGVYMDYKKEPIDMFVRRSFAEGVRPIDYLASTFGTRSSVIATKNCWMRGTLVRMADLSVKPIEEIKIGDEVLGADENAHVKPTRVTNVFDQGLQEVYEYALGLQSSNKISTYIRCTDDHKLLKFSNSAYAKEYWAWRKGKRNTPPSTTTYNSRVVLPAKHGKTRKFKCAPRAGAYEPEDVKHEPYAGFLGAMTGDGCVTRGEKTFACGFSCNDPVMLTDFSTLLNTLNLKITKAAPDDVNQFGYTITQQNYTPHDNQSTRKGHQDFISVENGSGVPHRNKLRAEGLAYKYAYEKTLPKNIGEWDNLSIADYIAYYFACDGSVCKACSKGARVTVSFASTSEQLLIGLAELLQTRFSIYTQPLEERENGGFGNSTEKRIHKLYILKISSTDGLHNFLNFIQPHIPGYKRDKVYTLITQQQSEAKQYQPDGFSVRVATPLGLQPCYDIEVNNNSHLFVLESGIIGSNSTADAGDLGKLLVQNALPIMVNQERSSTPSGIMLDPDEDDLRGRVLARGVAGYPPGTVVSRKVEAAIRNKHKGRVMVYSPLSEIGGEGISGEAFGVDYTGNIPGKGFAAGVTAGNSISEPIAQCLDAETRVRMADGKVKRICDIKPGDLVLGSDKSGFVRPVEVLNLLDNGEQECYEYTLRTGYSSHTTSLVCTENHRVLRCKHNSHTRENTYEVNNLESVSLKATSIAVPQGGDDITENHVYIPEARLIGILLGDGCITGGISSGGIGVSAYDPSMVGDLGPDLSMLGLILHANTTPGEFRLSMKRGSSATPQKTSINTYTRNIMKRILVNEGLWGCGSHDKKLPHSIAFWDNESVYNLLAGYLATDGCVTQDGKISFGSSSKELIEGIRWLITTRVGASCSKPSPNCKKKSNGIDLYAPVYNITISGHLSVMKFIDKISNSVPGVKRQRLFDLRDQGTKKKSGLINPIIVGKNLVGTRHVFDLEVDHPDHLFVLESGLIVHNSSLNSKHSGGAYSGGKKVFSGFDYLSQFVQVPDSFKDRAAVSEVGGRVQSIEDAPQGGKYVTVNDERHYVLPDMEVLVKPGDEVEPGDILSDGLANPKDIIRLRGLGEGRRYYSRRLKQLLDDSDQPAQLRNTEVIARGSLDAVKITDPDFEGHTPDSVTSYNRLEADWKPREGHEDRLTRQSEGRYLETPLLHYTIGTKLTPRMLNELEEAGYEKIKTHHKPPPFEPMQIRLRTQSYEVNPDWLARTGSSYLQKNLAESAQRGYDTNLKENPHPYPRLAVGEGFGANIKDTGKF